MTATTPPPAITPTTGRSRSELREAGRALRAEVPRRRHANWDAPADRDAIALLRSQDRHRLPELVPVRYGRMLVSPFAFYRGAALVMASDLAATPSSGIRVQACGDAHLLNFGVFGSAERRLVFDINDFDETHPAPWEWDVKRLAASFVVAARDVGLREDHGRDAAAEVVRAYQRALGELAEMTPLEIFHDRIDVDDLLALAARTSPTAERRVRQVDQAARRRTSRQAFRKLVETEPDGSMRIREDPPLIVRADARQSALIDEFMTAYGASLPAYRANVLQRYRVVEVARKVVGVGSVGLRAFVVLLVSEADGDPLFLQVKEAVASVIGPSAGAGGGGDGQGRRVVQGQQLMQAAGDPFLGWVDHPLGDFYVRQFRDMKASVEPERSASWFTGYPRLCGTALARAHARSVDPALLGGYLGSGERCAEAIARFAVAYADRSEADWELLKRQVRDGRVEAIEE